MTTKDAISDLGKLEPLLFAFWAPYDADPKAPAGLLEDDLEEPLSNNDVIRARNAWSRLLQHFQQQVEC